MDNKLFKTFARGKKTDRVSNNNCVNYTRVSGAKQMDGLSLEVQLKGIEEYAKRHNLITREHFGGTYESAASDERKEFQRMITYIKTAKYKITKVLVYSLERFSRNENSIWLSSQLRKLGIDIISVTQPIDTSNPAGVMQQKILFIFGQFDNELRRSKSIAGIKEHLLSGEWVSAPPVGYDQIKINGQKKFVLNEASKIIKKIFLWKADRLTNSEIQKRLVNFKVNYSLRRINEILENPFYCGMMAHKALEGEILEGKHEKLITKELFLQVNGIIAEKKHGLQTKIENKEIALKRFVRCDGCKQPMRGYISTKNNAPYYKCNTQGCKCNRNAAAVNERFLNKLSDYSVDVKYVKLIQYQLNHTITHLNASTAANQAAAKQKVNELNKRLERLEERFVIEEITAEIYTKYKAKFEAERDEIEEQIQKNCIDLSNLDNFISYSIDMSANLR